MASQSNPQKRKSKSMKRKDLFMTLRDKPEGGLVVMRNKERLFMCRGCQTTSVKAFKTEQEWFHHLQSVLHQEKHKGFDLHRYLWDVERTILINEIMGIQQSDILAYLSKAGCNVVDFRYLSGKPGGTNNCFALLASVSEVEQLSSTPDHYIGTDRRKFYIRLMHPDIKAKYLESRESFLQNCLAGKIDDKEDYGAGKKRRLE